MTIFEECAAEITEHNQRGLAWVLSSAYFQAERDTDIDRNPSFDTPIRANVRGSVRWNHVMALLKQACHEGRIVGFTPEWCPTGGNSPTNQVLMLRGVKCSITAAHVNDPKNSPRYAAFRRKAQDSNQMILDGFEIDTEELPEPPPGHMQLVLVHGTNDFDFAEVRCYYTNENGEKESTVIISNIERWKDEGGSTHIFPDQEPITPAPIELRPVAARSGASGK